MFPFLLYVQALQVLTEFTTLKVVPAVDIFLNFLTLPLMVCNVDFFIPIALETHTFFVYFKMLILSFFSNLTAFLLHVLLGIF